LGTRAWRSTLHSRRARRCRSIAVSRLKTEPTALDSQGGNGVRPAFKPNSRAVDTALETIEATLKALGLYETTNIVIAAEHAFSRVLKTSNTSRARSRLPREQTLGVLPAGFLAIDLLAALQIDHSDLELFKVQSEWTYGNDPRRTRG
jgi:hypothetical protein